MSLNWNLQNIHDHKNVCYVTSTYDDPMRDIKVGDRIMNPVTNALIWSTIAIDIGDWNAATMPMVWARISAYQSLLNPLMQDEAGGRFFTKEEVMAHTGLYCNVSFVRDAPWRKRIMDCHDVDAGRGLRPEAVQMAERWRESVMAKPVAA